jgi:hypothetical protein
MPGAAVDLADPNLAYVRPVGSVSSFEGVGRTGWWPRAARDCNRSTYAPN